MYDKDRQWIFLKLESMKLLKELDSYLIPPGEAANASFRNLDEKYFLNKE